MGEKSSVRESNAVVEKVISLVASAKKLPEEEVGLDDTFEELGLDSLDALDLLFNLEEEFDITIPDDTAAEIRTVRQAVAGVEALLAGGGE